MLRKLFLIILFVALPLYGALAAEIEINWEPNAETDLAGYRIYYNIDIFGPPYEFTRSVYLNELTDTQNPDYRITNLEDDHVYYVSITAFDTSDLESDFAEEIAADLTVSRQSSSAGGGGGCFISSLEKIQRRNNKRYKVLPDLLR